MPTKLLALVLLTSTLVLCQEQETPIIYDDYSTEPKTKLGERLTFPNLEIQLPICSISDTPLDKPTLSLSEFDGRTNGGKFYVSIFMTAYTGCDPARLDAPKFAAWAKQFEQDYTNVIAMTSYKGGGACSRWAELSNQTSRYPIYIQDDTRFLHYMFFSMHPQYVVLDKNMRVRHVFTSDELSKMGEFVKALVDEPDPLDVCEVKNWGQWSQCDTGTQRCGRGVETRKRVSRSSGAARRSSTSNCPPNQETKACFVPCTKSSTYSSCEMLPTSADRFVLVVNSSDHVQNPWDLEFNPLNPSELWSVNHDTDSFSVFQVGDDNTVVDSTRLRDRNPYHYMDQVSGLAWGRNGKISTSQASLNTYDGKMEANNFQGPTLYDTHPSYLVTHNNENDGCGYDRFYRNSDKEKECYLSHVDMLHESPMAMGIAYDPEEITPYQNVFWIYDGHDKQLVRFDFEQPHGPGSMDHALAQVRRYTDVVLTPKPGVPSHMHLDHASRHLYISDTGANRVLVVAVDSGKYLKDARVEYPIFSSQLPSFQYSIWGCTKFYEFAKVDTPSGIAVSTARVFVAEYNTGNILSFAKDSGNLIQTFSAPSLSNGLTSITLSPDLSTIWFTHTSNKLGYVTLQRTCPRDSDIPFTPSKQKSLSNTTAQTCSRTAVRSQELPPVIDHDAGYMNMDAITDAYVGQPCDEVNLDAILLAGYFCHRCLPNPRCMNGGKCNNLRYTGFKCDCNTDPNSPFFYYGDVCQHKVPKATHNTRPQQCSDLSIDGAEWHDAGGKEYTCRNHYAVAKNACQVDGRAYSWGGMSAQDACCVCGGGQVGGMTKRDVCAASLRVFCNANDMSQCSALEQAICA